MNPREGTAIISKQIIDFLSLLQSNMYSTPLKVFNGASVGQHIRHIIDFYLCLLKGIPTSEIDYDKRERNPAIESSLFLAQNHMKMIAQKVDMLDMNQAVCVVSCFVADENVETTLIDSSVGRELMYAYDHAIHHLALIKIGMQVAYPYVKIDKELGIAPSTLKYRKQHAR